MFVRWRSRGRLLNGQFDLHWSAILVESKRVDGKPRQRHVAYLGGIDSERIQKGYYSHFWDKVFDTLDRLQLSAAERERIESSVGNKVPRMSVEEYQNAARDSAE